MAIALVGTVVSSADTAGDFTNNNGGANISGDDDFVEGTGAMGDKMSSTTELLVSDNLSGGAAGVYDFSSGGADESDHFIGWINTKTPVNATSGLAVMFRNASGHEGTWNVMPASFYKGGFITRIINPELDFDTATTWTTTGNPAQLDDVSEMGFQFTTITSVMGSFNNVQVDQFTVGSGIRADVGSSGTPNTFEDVRSTDEDTNYWGWWSSANGSFVGKGKLYIGPATGSTASYFIDDAISVTFAEEKVATGFYEFAARGENTRFELTLANIAAANSTAARWGITLDSTCGSTAGGFIDVNGVYTGSDIIALNSYASMTGTTIIDGNKLTQNGASLTSLTITEPNVVGDEAYLVANTLSNISDCTFNQNTANTGHAVEITDGTASPFTFSGNIFNGYAPSSPGSNLVENTGDSEAMILNSSGSAITINITDDGTNPTIRNVGTGSTTTIVASVLITLTGMKDNTEVRVYTTGSTTELAGIENATAGSEDDRSFAFSVSSGASITIRTHNTSWLASDIIIASASAGSIPVAQTVDRSYANPALMPTFDGTNLIITLDAATPNVDVAVDLYSDWKEWVALSDNAKFYPAFRATGGDPLSPGIDAGAYYFLRNDYGWRIRPAEEDANITFTGNLAGEDNTLDILLPTIGNYTVLINGLQPITQSVADLLIQQQLALYNGEVWVDQNNGTAGTSFPAGTSSVPVDTLADAIIIAQARGLRTYVLHHGVFTLSDSVVNTNWQGRGNVTIDVNGQDISGAQFSKLKLTGTAAPMTQSVTIIECELDDLYDVCGDFKEVSIHNELGLAMVDPNPEVPAGRVDTSIDYATSHVAGDTPAMISLANTHVELTLRKWSGGLELKNSSNTLNKVSIGIESGAVTLHESVIEGEMVIRGMGDITNNAGANTTVVTTAFLPSSKVSRTSDFFKYT